MRAKHCTSLTGKHKFEPRFDEKPRELNFDVAALLEKKLISPKMLRELLVTRVYVYDICRNCSDVQERLKP